MFENIKIRLFPYIFYVILDSDFKIEIDNV